eukprot:7382105-Lingulodinium_polyedra.AAC.1
MCLVQEFLRATEQCRSLASWVGGCGYEARVGPVKASDGGFGATGECVVAARERFGVAGPAGVSATVAPSRVCAAVMGGISKGGVVLHSVYGHIGE